MLRLALIMALVLTAQASAHFKPGHHNLHHAVNLHFCGKASMKCNNGREAIRVIDCETGGTFSPFAKSRDGLYYGLFQAGEWFRDKYGFAWNIWTQVKAGAEGFRNNGYCWTCNRQWPNCGKGLDS